eukprot:TRINITY_DN1103_c0_g1_i2.p1 TRINITY_DN1103_c0_g1~~TRINITY_DN1103_c0_g1_i2.p1  ORF type:complete len:1319 (+),score=357.16 TRINITY_DN1103_c0_g1_i2:146-4102(+)
MGAKDKKSDAGKASAENGGKENKVATAALDLDGQLREHTGPSLSDSNFLSRLTFWPATPVVRAGAKKPIEKAQLFRLPQHLRAHHPWKRFHTYWKEEFSAHGEEASLFRALRKTFLGQWLMCMLLQFIYTATQFVAPVLLPFLLDFITEGVYPIDSARRTIPSWHGYVYSAAIVVSSAIGAVFFYHASLRGWALGIQIKSVLTLLTYRKALYVAPSKSKTGGNITNLVSGDAQLFQDTLSFFNQSFMAPVMITACTILIGTHGGLKAFSLIPLAVLALLFPINIWLGKKTGEYRARSQRAADTRIKFVRELISAIRVVKYYAWERPLNVGIAKARAAELKEVKSGLMIRSWMFFAIVNVPTLGIALVYFFKGIEAGVLGLEPKSVFTSLALMNLMRGPFIWLPLLLSTAQQYKVTLERIGAFVKLPELTPRAAEFEQPQKYMIKLKKASFRWPSGDSETDHLRDLTMKVKRGTVTMVVGAVGSGKSTLGSALLGEVRRTSGTSEVYGSIAYVAQEAWIINATVRDNITFGKPFDPKLYLRVIKASALETDFAIMPAGDMTEIGDRGINLSGGQKQRVSIARALYAQKDLYILDDPFSAVDAHVGQHLFEQAVRGFLVGDNRTVVLVTNQLQYLPHSDQVVFLQGGQVAAQGTFAELKSEVGSDFVRLINEFGVIEDTSSSDEDGDGKKKKKPAPLNKKGAVSTTAEALLALKAANPATDQEKLKKGNLTGTEAREKGNIGIEVYWHYFKSGSLALFFFLMFNYSLRIAARTHNAIWLADWTSLRSQAYNTTICAGAPCVAAAQPQLVWESIYLTTTVVEMITVLIGGIMLAYWTVRAGSKLHDRLLQSVLRAPISFFDATPMGRLLTRFAKDTQLVDQLLPQQFDFAFTFLFNLLGIFAQLAAGNQFILIVILPSMIIFYFLQWYYRKTSIEIQRLESISRAPILSHLSETLDGAATIRAYGMTKNFKVANINKVDMNNVDFYSLRYCAAWFGLRLDWVGTCIILATYFALVITRNYTVLSGQVAALSGLAMSVTTNITFFLSAFSQNWAELETRMNSVERMKEYDNLEQEAPEHIPETQPPREWPSKGSIRFKGLSISYNNEDRVLKQVSASIKAKEKIGIVGRTGAGKSTLITALFRMQEFFEGTIDVDGIDISKIGLFDLRSKLSIIPQTPQLFMGTVRYNVDPFDERTDEEIWHALDLVHLKKHVEGLEGKLASPVSENGSNFSVGQRQLISMARALLRNTHILLLDEATAAVDTETDAMIQRMIRTIFKDKTVLTIAHRLNTIMDSDRIMVRLVSTQRNFQTLSHSFDLEGVG